MSVFSWIGDLFSPAADLVDDLHYSGEEKAELKNKLAEIEAKVATRTLDLQSQLIEATSKVAMSEQQHGNIFTKSVRPAISVGCFIMLMLMGIGSIPKDDLLMKICGGWLGVYGGLRSWEKKK